MRRTVRVFSSTGPTQRLAEAIAGLPPEVRRSLAEVAERRDLPLVAGSWRDGDSGCLVANVVATLGAGPERASHGGAAAPTLDLQMLDLVPQMSSRDLNGLIVAWDEAADLCAASDDASLRTLLRDALTMAGVEMPPVESQPSVAVGR